VTGVIRTAAPMTYRHPASSGDMCSIEIQANQERILGELNKGSEK